MLVPVSDALKAISAAMFVNHQLSSFVGVCGKDKNLQDRHIDPSLRLPKWVYDEAIAFIPTFSLIGNGQRWKFVEKKWS